MRAKPSIHRYLEMRITQLQEDLERASDPMDRAWYNRLIQELSWANNFQHNCWQGVGTDARSSWFKEQKDS